MEAATAQLDIMRTREASVAIVRSPSEISVTSDLRQDLQRRVAESVGVSVASGALFAVLTLLEISTVSLATHFVVGAALPWLSQLLVLPNSLGAAPIPSHTLRITETHVVLERYGVEYGRVARPVVVRREPWWSPLEGVVLRGVDGRLRLRRRAFGATEERALATLLSAADAPLH